MGESPEQSARYKDYLIEHADDFGLKGEDIAKMEQPVLVNMLNVGDAAAITLGQYRASDTESGGKERIMAKNVAQRMGADIRGFAELLLRSGNEDASFAELLDSNGPTVLRWMSERGYITPTQHQSAYDSKGYLTGDAKNDLRGVMYQGIFQGGSTQLEEMFEKLPAKAQKGILSTAFRDYDSPNGERMLGEVQSSIMAYYALSGDAAFAKATNFKEARLAVEEWKSQYQFDDATGESYLPAENFSNFALLLATMYKRETQSSIQSKFNKLYDLIQGTQEDNLFEQADNTPRTLVQAIREVLNIEYDGQRRSDVLVGDASASQRGQQGSTGDAATGKRVESGYEQDDNSAGTQSDSGQLRNDEERKDTLSEVIEISSAERTEMETRIVDWLSEDNLSRAVGKTREEIFDEFGNERMPIAYIPTQFISLVSPTLKDQRIYCGKGYFIDHALRNHAGAGVQVSIDEVDVSKYLNIQTVLDNPDHIKETYVDGKRTVVFIKKIGRFFAELTQVEENGKVVLHKSFFNQKKEPYAKLNDIRQEDTSSEGGTSSISHTAETAPAISLQSRGDVMSNDDNPSVSNSKDTTLSRTTKELGEKKVDVGAKKVESGEIRDNSYKTDETYKSDKLESDAPYSIAPAQYTTKKGKVLDMHLVKFAGTLTKEQQRAAKELAKADKGWYDREQVGFMMRSEASAKQLAETIIGNEEAVRDAQPLTKQDLQDAVFGKSEKNDVSNIVEGEDAVAPRVSSPINRVNIESLFGELREKGEAKLSDYAEEVAPKEVESQSNRAKITDEMKRDEDILRDILGIDEGEIDSDVLFRDSDELTPEQKRKVYAAGVNYSIGYIEQGIVSFEDFARAMTSRLGGKIKPWLKSFYEGAKRIPGYEDVAFTSSEAVDRFDVEAIDKGNSDLFNNAALRTEEQKVGRASEQARKEITEVRNENRKREDEQTSANTEALAKEAGAVASEARIVAKTSTVEQELNRANERIERALDKVNDQLALLGFYEAEEVDKDYNEMYGYMRNAEKKAVQDAVDLAKRLVKDLGIDVKVTSTTTAHSKKESAVSANIAPIGGYVAMRLPLQEGRELYVSIGLERAYEKDARGREYATDNLTVNGMMYRVDNPSATGIDRYGSNNYGAPDMTYDNLLSELRNIASRYLPERAAATGRKQNDAKGKKVEKKAVTSQVETMADLFGGQYGEAPQVETKKGKNDGLQRTDAVRPEGLSADDRGDTGRGGNESGNREVQQESGRTDGRGESGGGEIGVGVQQRDLRPRLHGSVEEAKNARNNHSERGKDHAPTAVDARIDANIKAIELSKQLLDSGEAATERQMQVLRKFSGWGGLGKAFSETGYSPNPTARRLRELLGEEGYQQAVMSANSAYYTPAYVVDTLWDIAEKLGFKGGNILEGSAGIGNILGQMPTHISERRDISAIEIDGTSGGILSLLYPDANVEIQGFEQTRIANGSVDLAITNVPFVTGLRVSDTSGDKDLSKKFHNIHDFCIAKNVRKLREGGLGIFITSNGTLDSSKKLRDWVVSEGNADFIGAFRMNNKTFGGTGVTSDIIVIRKRVNGQKSANAIDVSTVTAARVAEYDTGESRKVKGVYTPVVKQLSMDYNSYFIEHPENMAGEMRFAFEKGDTFRPTSKGLYPKGDMKQEQMLAEWISRFAREEAANVSNERATTTENFVGAVSGKKVGEMFVQDGKLYVNSIGEAHPLAVNANKVKGHTKAECFEAYTAIKKALADVLEYQTNNDDDAGLKPLLSRLNKAYDAFVKTYGHFNKNTAISFLRNDVDYANVAALEKFDETADAKGNKVAVYGKTDIFSKRVVSKYTEPKPTNVKDGIIASVFKYGRVDVPYIAEQLGKDAETIKSEIIESGYGYEDPISRQVEVSYQYLSGNVREKLRQAQENNERGEYDRNIKALRDVIPPDIPAHLIEFTLGSSWVDSKIYSEYVKERTDVDVTFTAVGGTWYMGEPYWTNREKNRAMGVVSEKLGKTILGHTLIEAAIQNKTITVSTTKKYSDSTTETITDKEATQACSAKIEEIRQDFKDWARQKMQSDPELSQRMEQIYNEMFNNYVAMKIPSEFVPEFFPGAARESNGKELKMYAHQGKAIVRGTMQPLLLAHEVGTGKTFTLISTAMEMRRLGTARKPMIVVQNATVGQFVESAKELYPNAKILTLEEADRNAEGRKNFYAKIRYNDWDMIVVPQSTFEFIPDSEERQMAFVQDKIEEKVIVLEQMKEADSRGNSPITRQAEREIEQLRAELAELGEKASKKRSANDEKKRAVAMQNAEVKAMEMLDRKVDEVENFDEMGIDALLIDEAHEYKHLGVATAMQRGVKGVDPSYSKKSQGVYLKTRAVLEKSNGRNVIFATGTPISNTAAEIWTFMRYLMPADTMKEYGIYYFDDFVRNFGNIQQMLEFSTSGKFKENNRFAGYINLPELVRIWSGVSDTVLTKEAGKVSDKIPEIEGGKAQDIYLPQTRALRSIMKYVKGELAKYEEMSGKEKKENSHIPLTMYGIAKAAAVDARLVQADAEDDPQSKTNEAVRQTLRSLKETADYKGTVAIFADNYQNKQSGFNLYDDIREKLIAEGVPANEVVVIKSGMSIKKKLEIFDKVNSGEIRVVLGSTFTLGTGVNIQERLHTLIHLDAPNRPMDYTQRNGRILRQGNLHKNMGKTVRVLRFGVEDSLDVTAYQRLKTKGAIADSIMNGKELIANSMTNRVLEEEEDVFGDTVAQLSGSEYAMLKNNAEKNMRKYESRKKQWEADQTYIHNAKPRLMGQIKDAEGRIFDNSTMLKAVGGAFPEGRFNEIVVGKHSYGSIEEMTEFIKSHNKSVAAAVDELKTSFDNGKSEVRELKVEIDGYAFVVRTELEKEVNRKGGTLWTEVHRKMTYSSEAFGLKDVPVKGGLLRVALEDITKNVITGKDFAERLEAAERDKKHNEAELKQLLSREGRPFEYEKELEDAKKQYAEYSELMKAELEEKEAKYAEIDAKVKSAENVAEASEEDGVVYRDSEVTKDRVEMLFIQSVAGELKGKPVAIGRLTEAGKAYLKELSGIEFKDDVDFVLNPSDMVHIYRRHFGHNEKDGKNIPLDLNDIRSIVDIVSNPDKVIFSVEAGPQERKMFSFIKEAEQGSYNLLEIYSDRKGNLTAKSFYKSKEGVSQRAISLVRTLHSTSETGGATLNTAAKIPQMFETPKVGEEISEREGVVAYTDAEVSFENDPRSKVLGKSYRSGKQQKAFAERERGRMVNRVKDIAARLHLDNVEIVTDVEQLEGRKRRAKGFYSKSTGKIVIVIPNHVSTTEVELTLLHEAVGHYGLRQLFGEHFDTFIENVYENAEADVKARINESARTKHNGDYYTATEEYLASLAEDTEFVREPSLLRWWRKIKQMFLNVLHKLGMKGFNDVTLSDNELRYVLWRSYENLAEPGKYRNTFTEAADIAKQYELKVGEYAEKSESDTRVAEEAEAKRGDLAEINARFNEELSKLTEENADKIKFDLGRPSDILLAAGIEDRPMKLYANKVIKKMKRHGFSLGELTNLPIAVADPIAVFNNLERRGNRAILTELQTAKGNFLVTVDLGKGGDDIDFNIISSVFGKGNDNIVDWIERGLSTYINKEKALNYLHHSALNAEALSSSRLNSAAKIVESFENPKVGENFAVVGNMTKAVDESGKPLVLYHANGADLDYEEEGSAVEVPIRNWSRDVARHGFWFTPDADYARKWIEEWMEYDEKRVSKVTLDMQNPLEVDAKGQDWKNIDGKSTDEWAQYAEQNGYDGLIIRNVLEGTDSEYTTKVVDDYCVFDPKQIKSAEEAAASFAARRDRAAEENGYVHSGLNSAEVKVVAIKEKSLFDTSKKTKELKEEVVSYATERGIIGTMTEKETRGKGKVTISKSSIAKMVDDSAAGKSVDKHTHIAIIPQLREVISESIIAETHPDYKKGEDGIRNPENGFNSNMLIHRCYGAVDIEGTTYRVKITLKEDGSHKESPQKAYTYEVTKIELLDSTDGEGVPSTSYTSNPKNGSNEIFVSGANLLKNVEKSYDKGKKLLSESELAEGDVLYRDGEPELHERALTRRRYAERVGSGWYQTKEALQDSMLGLKEAMLAIAGRKNGKKVYIEDIAGFENAYLGENRLSSTNKAEADAMAQLLFKPMLKEIAKLARNRRGRRDLMDYMMAKHGLERNAYMRAQAEANGEDTERDFAGLTALTILTHFVSRMNGHLLFSLSVWKVSGVGG